jgi:hypothetical protein
LNKFSFIAGNQKQTQKNVEDILVEPTLTFCKDYKKSFTFTFLAGNYPFENVVRETDVEDHFAREFSRSSGFGLQIVKSDINDSVTRQIKEMIAIVRKTDELLYLRMNKETKNKFRMYYNYEVSYPPRNLTAEDKQVGKIVGSIMGVKIIEDNSTQTNVVRPVVRHSAKLKFSKIFKNK